MSIFNFDSDPPSLSRDWQVFQQFMGNIGAFTYISREKTAYLDPAARRMLSCSREKINEFEFFNLLEKISKNPVKDHKHIYKFTVGSSSKYIKMNIYESSEEWLGFVQDYTRQLTDSKSSKNNTEIAPVTKLSNFQEFSEESAKILHKSKCCYMATIYIDGFDKLENFLTVQNANNCIASIAETIQSFAGDNIIICYRSNYEYCLLFNHYNRSGVIELLKSICTAIQKCVMTDEFGEIIKDFEEFSICPYIGCVGYPDEAADFNKLISFSKFALYEAKSQRQHDINWFSPVSYKRESAAYKNSLIFSKLLRNNQFTYQFQPIIEAKTGEIIGYEALMGLPGDNKTSYSQILKIANESDNLYAIEKITISNALKYVNDNPQVFKNRKLFFSCIPENMLTDDYLNELYIDYGKHFEKTVIEITERNGTTHENLKKLKERCRFVNAELAINSYGSGYFNPVNLLNYSPNYIKFDRFLIKNIHNDQKKQQIVASIIDFCRENQIMTIANGIETKQELKTVIRLGTDLIQGNYTAKPDSLFNDKISDEIRNNIIQTNLEARPSGAKKIYTAKSEHELNLLELSLQKYTDIHIYQSKLTLISEPDKQIKMNISIMDNHSCELTLKGVNITSISPKPTISVGEYANLILNIQNDNKLSNSGIFVPMGSQIEITGKGNLAIDCDSPYAICVGSDFEHSYGDIKVNMQGTLQISTNCDETICIGGGYNDAESEIDLISGCIQIFMHSQNGLAVGSFNGNSIINIEETAKLDLNISGTNIIGIGSSFGRTEIKSSADMNILCSGAHAAGIGALENGNGSIDIKKGKINIKIRSAKNSCIGTANGNINVKINSSDIEIDSEGHESIGIGDIFGIGDITISDSVINLNMHSEDCKDIGTKKGRLDLYNCKINSIINEKEVLR